MPNGPDHTISMLGAPSSGKTTFLAALSIALTLDEREQGWNVIGGDPASRQALVDMTLALNQDRSFPEATAFAIERYRWLLIGKVWQSVKRSWLGTKRVLKSVRIGLDLADASGGLSDPQQANHPSREDLINNILKSRGIVFLFDPIIESNSGDSFKYLFSVLAEVAQRMATDNDPDFEEGTLPHHVAVCIAKFDELRVLSTAEKLNMIRTDPNDRYEFPRIHDEDAREFLLELCRVLNTGNTELVMKTIEKHFRKDRIKYFVTSAIGFYVNPNTNEYDPDDIQNVLPDPNDPKGKLRIRGSIHPINVVEPLMWLAGKLTGLETQ